LPGCLERLAAELEADRSIAMVAGARRLIDENGEQFATSRYTKEDAIISGADAINRCIFGSNYIGEPSAVMFRRTLAKRGFNENFSLLMDLEMWFCLLEQGDLIALASETCAIRRHSGQMTHNTITTGALWDDNMLLFANYGNKPYIRHSLAKSAGRTARMVYRAWLCRQNLVNRIKSHLATTIR
jgi:hypothetical protein